MVLALATIHVALTGVRFMFSAEHPSEQIYRFGRTLLAISLAYTMIAFYQRAIPDRDELFAVDSGRRAGLLRILDTRAVEHLDATLSGIGNRFLAPSILDVGGTFVFWAFQGLLVVAKAGGLALVAGGLVMTALCVLLGPICVPFFLAPQQLQFVFWGWVRALLISSMVPVVAVAYMLIGQVLLSRFLTTLPAGVPMQLWPIYGAQTAVILVVFVLGLRQIPMLTFAIFSGHVSTVPMLTGRR